MYELKLEQFSGPIDKLLSLIEEKKMTITELSLAEITASFLAYLESLKVIEKKERIMEDIYQPRLLADFIAIAAHLLLIKSKALLPDFELTKEEESEIKDLELRLRFYQNFKPAINHLKELWDKKEFSISRPLFFGRQSIFYPSQNLNVSSLHKTVSAVLEMVKQWMPEMSAVRPPAINFEEKIQEIISRVTASLGINHKFGDLIHKKPKAEIVVLFLALLHLLDKQSIEVEQKEKFSDIIIKKHGG